MSTFPVTLSFRHGVTISSEDSHVRVHAEMNINEIKEAVASLLRKLEREDASELAEKLTKELYQ